MNQNQKNNLNVRKAYALKFVVMVGLFAEHYFPAHAVYIVSAANVIWLWVL